MLSLLVTSCHLGRIFHSKESLAMIFNLRMTNGQTNEVTLYLPIIFGEAVAFEVKQNNFIHFYLFSNFSLTIKKLINSKIC